MPDRPAVFVLRPQPGAARTAAKLAASGYHAMAVPLTGIVPVEAKAPSRPQDALVFSSQNGVRHGAVALAEHQALPAFCVGTQTAAALKARGFSIAATAPTAQSLLPAIAASGAQNVLYACGRTRRPDIENGLARAAIICTVMECYQTVPVQGALEELARHIAGAKAEGRCPVLLLHAPSAAALIAPLVDVIAVSDARLLCLSDAVSDALAPKLAGQAHVAAAPDEDALLHLLTEMHPVRLFVAADMQAP